jgi:hypothetical protein
MGEGDSGLPLVGELGWGWGVCGNRLEINGLFETLYLQGKFYRSQQGIC